MEAEIEAQFAGFQERIDNAKRVLDMCQQIEAEIMKIADEHERIGDRGMADRAERLKTADHERFYQMSDEYTEVVQETIPAMASLVETLMGVFGGALEMKQRKSQIAN